MARSNRTIAVACVAFGVLAIVVASGFFAMTRHPTEHTYAVGTTLPAAALDHGTPAKPILYFPDGTNWQLTGIRDYPAGTRWWGADGSEVAMPQADLISIAPAAHGYKLIELRYRADADDAFWRRYVFRSPSHAQLRYTYRAQSQVFGTGAVILAVRDSEESGDLEVGGAATPWNILLQADVDLSGEQVRATTRPVAPSTQPNPPTFGRIDYQNGRLRVELLNPPLADLGVGFSDVSAVTKSGRPIRWKTIGYANNNNLLIYEFVLPRTSVGSIICRTRDVGYVPLRHLPWRPKSAIATTRAASTAPATTPSMQ